MQKNFVLILEYFVLILELADNHIQFFVKIGVKIGKKP